MPREHREVPLKQRFGIRKSGKVFGQVQKTAKQFVPASMPASRLKISGLCQ